ncbi:DUF4317 domain-containing protein [Lederbergia galactosidilytica]|uniref:DUF4317 family protein n=1 Tax=Lederbergia galactosidilytica TaxID=217031 RepID=A0A178A950_9BACI|nr:DUF4317 domain-containing protein [Lederbergia galactosidilytica]KRG16337.1 hypothetical protein ACA30_01100 [Virgibacillus soli]MBP1915085.1 hypothetical protein [Lederbergia galactosidilytica]OAK75548.1 hypothetical protein ABB05_02300 [Lederbergia galactosidilytica]
MNKKDIADIRKQFKLDNDLLKIHDIFNVYIRKESSEIYHQESNPFPMLEREQQELFMANFKKVLTGKVDQKLFEVRFQEQAEDHTQVILYEALNMDDGDWEKSMLQIVEKMFKDVEYEKDMVVSFIRGEYFKPTKKSNDEAEISDRDEVYLHPFILCSMNQTDQPKKSLVFDYIEKEFKASVAVDSIINLKSPVAGFLFPCFTENSADVNHILYSAGKKLDYHFIENVLNGEEIMTAEDDKAVFEEIVKEVVGEEVDTSTLSNVYEEINRIIDEEEEDEAPKLDYKDVERVLKVSGVEDVDTDKVEMAFQKVIDDEKYEMKASSVIPSFASKSIKIQTKVANIAISPQDIKYVKQVNYNGKRCLLIEVDEDTFIDGFKIIPETSLSY